MNILGDFHSHSKFSKINHGKNTIAEMADAAKDKGLKFLAITDHGPKHIMFGIRPRNFAVARAQIEEINKSGDLKVYLGCEANIINRNGDIDLTRAQIEFLDILAVGFHKGTIHNLADPLLLFANTKKNIEKNTDAYVKMLKKYPVDFITHPCEYVNLDCKRLAQACAENDTLIELNNRHFRFSEQQMKEMLETEVKFIINSDAHRAQNIKEVSNSLAMVKLYNIPEERIVNLDKEYIPKKFRTKDE